MYYSVDSINHFRLGFSEGVGVIEPFCATKIDYVIIGIFEMLRNTALLATTEITKSEKIESSECLHSVSLLFQRSNLTKTRAFKSCEKIKLAAAYFDNDLDCFFLCATLFVRNSNDLVFFFTFTIYIEENCYLLAKKSQERNILHLLLCLGRRPMQLFVQRLFAQDTF